MPFEIKSFANTSLNVLLIIGFLLVQGCALAAPAAITYGAGKLSAPPTQAAQPAPPSSELRTYPEYVTAMERINTDREKAGLSRRPIMTQEEWVNAQMAGSTTPPAPAATSSPAPVMAPATTAAPAASPVPAPAASPEQTPEKATAAQ